LRDLGILELHLREFEELLLDGVVDDGPGNLSFTLE
jgi:hypothetical protein